VQDHLGEKLLAHVSQNVGLFPVSGQPNSPGTASNHGTNYVQLENRDSSMTSLPRASLSKTTLRAATVALPCAILLAIFAAPSARAQTFTTLYRFTGGTDGGYPTAELIRDATGNLYSTTIDGGDIPCNGGGQFGCGTVFKLSPGNKETVLYAYTGDADGAYPYAGLVRDVDGILYGAASQGGDYACPISDGCGTVFQVDAAGKERVLYSFSGQADGAAPMRG
jgi:uncharacterized repeat protein (TIGR03803 family)